MKGRSELIKISCCEGGSFMRIDQISQFSEVVRCGSITKAAEKLFVTQPTLSASLNAMERELGVKLLERTPRGIQLTCEGKKVYEDSQSILSTVSTWYALGQRAARHESSIRINAIPPAYYLLSNHIVDHICKKFPDLNIFLNEAKNADLLKPFKKNEYHIIFGSYIPDDRQERIRFFQDIDWSIEDLFQDELEIFISTSDPLATRPYLTKEDCSRLVFAQYFDHRDTTTDFFQSFFPQRSQLNLPRWTSILDMIAQGQAVAFYPKHITACHSYVREGKIRSLPIENIYIPTTHYIAFPLWLDGNSLCQEIVSLIKQEIQNIFGALCLFRL